MLEDKTLALKWAQEFLFEVKFRAWLLVQSTSTDFRCIQSIKPDSKYAVAGVSQQIGIVLNIFLRMEKYDLLNMQLQGVEVRPDHVWLAANKSI